MLIDLSYRTAVNDLSKRRAVNDLSKRPSLNDLSKPPEFSPVVNDLSDLREMPLVNRLVVTTFGNDHNNQPCK